MRDTLRPGLRHTFTYRVPESKLVPALYPEAAEFQAMPRVFATGFLIGLLEWTCIQAVNPYLDWPREQTVGTRVDVSHAAPTPPGKDVMVEVELTAVDGRRLVFRVSAKDDAATICEGTHERFVVDAQKFNARLAPRIQG
ncbi:MAG TPA: thioesterase family protein [Gemmatimonadales bacterium]|nr:thioesterase family protein [Gemmatimonadales bacterium]